MTIGTVFTLFVVPVFYSLIAAQHRREDPEAVSSGDVSADRIPAFEPRRAEL